MTVTKSNTMTSTDVESLERRVARSRRMEMCLVGSVVVLFMLVFLGFGAAVLFAWNLKTGSELVHDPAQLLRSVQEDFDSKGQSFAYLRAKIHNDTITKGVMDWEPIAFGNSKTLGSGYEYNANQRALTVKQEGTYFLYVQLNVSCKFKCDNEKLIITFGNNFEPFSCTLELPGYETVVKKCWTVIPHLDKDSKLLATIHLDKELKYRQLQVNSSGFGIFRVAGPGTD